MTADRIPQTVLIVDDQQGVAQHTETMLLEIGVADVTTAHTAIDALGAIENACPDLALLDYDLGMETGWTVAQRLCEAEIRMIVTTEEEFLILPAVCEGSAILKRPYNLNVLAALIAREPGPAGA